MSNVIDHEEIGKNSSSVVRALPHDPVDTCHTGAVQGLEMPAPSHSDARKTTHPALEPVHVDALELIRDLETKTLDANAHDAEIRAIMLEAARGSVGADRIVRLIALCRDAGWRAGHNALLRELIDVLEVRCMAAIPRSGAV